MSYATGADMLAYYDSRTLGDLLSDTGQPVADVAADPTLATHLSAASGRIDSALTVANLYTTTDLAALTGGSLDLLKQLTCALALASLLKRRAGAKLAEVYQAAVQEAEEYLDRLRKGERVFGVTANRDAGEPEIDGPTTVDYQNLNLIPDRVRNYYPRRATRLPLNRG